MTETVYGELQGCRECMQVCFITATGSKYMVVGGTSASVASATYGRMINRNGSIVGFSGMLTCSAKTVNGTVTPQVKVNDVLKVGQAVNITATGVYSFNNVYARGTYTFTAGQFFDPYILFDGTFAGTISIADFTIEIVYDS